MSEKKRDFWKFKRNEPTVTVDAVPGYPLLRITCKAKVDKHDAVYAFNAITDRLNTTREHLYVLVDIRQNTHFPLKEIIGAAFWGPYRHPRLVAWLVVGTNSLAWSAERVLLQITGRHNVYWFDNETEVFTYIEQHMSASAGS